MPKFLASAVNRFMRRIPPEYRPFQWYFAAYLLNESSRFAFTSGPIAE